MAGDVASSACDAIVWSCEWEVGFGQCLQLMIDSCLARTMLLRRHKHNELGKEMRGTHGKQNCNDQERMRVATGFGFKIVSVVPVVKYHV